MLLWKKTTKITFLDSRQETYWIKTQKHLCFKMNPQSVRRLDIQPFTWLRQYKAIYFTYHFKHCIHVPICADVFVFQIITCEWCLVWITNIKRLTTKIWGRNFNICFGFHSWINWINKHILKNNTISYDFTVFIFGGPCHPSSLK